MPVTAVVTGRQAEALLLGPHGVELLFGVVGAVRKADGDELLGMLLIEWQPLRLNVGRVRPADADAFVPVEPEPAQSFDLLVDAGRGLAVLVGVFDAEDERAAHVTGEQPVEDGGANVSNVRRPRRRWRVPHAYVAHMGTSL